MGPSVRVRTVTLAPRPACSMALWIRLPSNSSSNTGWPSTDAGSRSKPRSCPACKATASQRSALSAASSRRSIRWSKGLASSAALSARASESSCCARRLPRSAARCRRSSAGCRAAGCSLASSSDASTRTMAHGVRNWCAASATKACCAPAACLSRAKRPLSVCTKPATSLGMLLASMGRSCCTLSRPMASDARCRGCSTRLMASNASAARGKARASAPAAAPSTAARKAAVRFPRVSATSTGHTRPALAQGKPYAATRTDRPMSLPSKKRHSPGPRVAGASAASSACPANR